MKLILTLPAVFALSVFSSAFAQSSDMRGMEMKGMKGTDPSHKSAEGATHTADGVVKLVDPINSKVTLSHGAVKSLGWPAMTMAFAVKDKALLDKLVPGKEAHVEFNKQGSDYVITSVK